MTLYDIGERQKQYDKWKKEFVLLLKTRAEDWYELKEIRYKEVAELWKKGYTPEEAVVRFWGK